MEVNDENDEENENEMEENACALGWALSFSSSSLGHNGYDEE